MVNNFKEPDFMTRGTPYILYKKDDKLWIGSSNEFNGDMYPGGHYENLCKILSNVDTYEEFGFAIHEFNKKAHNYPNLEIYHQPLSEIIKDEKIIDFNIAYFDRWFSDYLFFLNLTGKTFTFRDTSGKKIKFTNTDVLTFHFGKFEDVFVKLSPIKTVNP